MYNASTYNLVLYRDEINSLQIQLSSTQAGPGRAVKEQQEQNSPNHVQRVNLISVVIQFSRVIIVRGTLPPLPSFQHQLGNISVLGLRVGMSPILFLAQANLFITLQMFLTMLHLT